MDYLNYFTYYYRVAFTILSVFCVHIKMEECGQEELTACAKPLQLLTQTSELSFVTKKSELDKLCPDLHAGLHCIRSYTRRCMNIHQRTHFNKLYHGTGEVINELCIEGPYQEDFLRHAPCMRHVKNEYEMCSKRYQNTMAKISQTAPVDSPGPRTMSTQTNHHQNNNSTTNTSADGEEGVKAVCCAFKEYIACSEHTVRRTCGNEAAFFTKSFLDKISNSLMRMHCEGHQIEPGKCGEPSSAPANTVTSSLIFGLSMVALFLSRTSVRSTLNGLLM